MSSSVNNWYPWSSNSPSIQLVMSSSWRLGSSWWACSSHCFSAMVESLSSADEDGSLQSPMCRSLLQDLASVGGGISSQAVAVMTTSFMLICLTNWTIDFPSWSSRSNFYNSDLWYLLWKASSMPWSSGCKIEVVLDRRNMAFIVSSSLTCLLH